MTVTLNHEQSRVLRIVGRSSSILSIFGIATIIGTFCFSRQFRNPVHRLVFINAFYNIFDVTATTISLSGPQAGNPSGLCQFQGFLMQAFPLADVFWTLAMAIDVFLIVFYKYDAVALRKLEIKYITVISTLTFIPAFTFLFIHTPEKGHVYGSQTLWCSISPKWVMYRIIFFYGPIWLTIFITMMLYCLVGVEILKQRQLFKTLGSDYVTLDTISSHNDVHFHAVTIDSSIQLPPSPVAKLHDRKAPEYPSITNPTSHLRQFETPPPALSPSPARQSPVSFRKYVLMPLMFFVTLLAVWTAPTTNRVASFIDPNYSSYPLLLAVGSTGSLRGFWNGVVFITIGMRARKRQKKIERTDV